MTTELAFAIDMSGSMYPMTDALKQGFNSLLARQRELDKSIYGDALVHTVLFNTKVKEYHDRTPIDKTPDLDETYHACGCTALVDAIYTLANRLELIHHYSRREDIPEHTVIIAFTDGAENSSTITCEELRAITESCRRKGFEFYIMSTDNIALDGKLFGIEQEHIVSKYAACEEGMQELFSDMNDICTRVRGNVPAQRVLTYKAVPDGNGGYEEAKGPYYLDSDADELLQQMEIEFDLTPTEILSALIVNNCGNPDSARKVLGIEEE